MAGIQLEMILEIVPHKNCAVPRLQELIRRIATAPIPFDYDWALLNGIPILRQRTREQVFSLRSELFESVGIPLKELFG